MTASTFATTSRLRQFQRIVVQVAVCLPFLAATGTIAATAAIPPAAVAAARSSAGVTSVRVYLVAINGGGNSGTAIGCGDSLVAVTVPIAPTQAPLSAAIRALLRNHQRTLGQSGLYNSLYRSHLTLTRAVVRHGKATIHMKGTLGLGGECDSPRVSAQLHRTALQFHSVHSATIFVNGVLLSRLLSLKG
jgi:hypothetical protein